MAVSLWRTIYDSLLSRIESGEIAPQTILPSEVDLACEWNVSRLTAHRALYELARTGLVTRKRKVGTVVLAASERPSTPITIAALFFETSDFFQGSYLSGIRKSLSDDYHLLYVDTAHDFARENQMLRRMQKEAAGIVLFATCAAENDALVQKIAQSEVPIVCIDRFPQTVACDAVTTDNFRAAHDSVQLLLSQGHRRIAHFTDHEMTVASVRERYRGYSEAMSEAGYQDPSLIRMFPYLAPRSDSEYEQMIQMTQDALVAMRHGPSPPTAVFCLRDHLVAAVCEASERIGLRIPEDLEVIGFVDRPNWLLRLPDTIWTIQQNVPEISRIATEQLLRRMAGEQFAAEKIMVPATVLPPSRELAFR